MEFMLLFLVPEGAPGGTPEEMAAMGRFVRTLADQGTLRRGAPLADARGHVRVRGGRASVVDGPFTETKEMLAGFWIVDVADRAEALDVARRCPHAQDGVVEVHPVAWRRDYGDAGEGMPFLFAFRYAPDVARPDRATLQECRRAMMAYSDTLARQRILLETAPLADDPPPARVEGRRGTLSVTDGPFAEVKEAVGGYGIVRVADRAAALALAQDYPHATWGEVEVREILFFDRT